MVILKEHRKQPETLRLRSMTPAFTVDDIQVSLAWYQDILGFVLDEKWEHDGKLAGATLKAGTVELILVQDDWAKGKKRQKGQGMRLYCDTVQDVDALASRIKQRGGRLMQEPKDDPWGSRTFVVQDPDGFKLSVSADL